MAVILITGCSSGFGMLTAARLAASGQTVYATMRNMAKKSDLLTEVKKRGGEVQLLRLDVTDDDSIREVIKEIETGQGRLDVLINNAGYGIGGFFEDLTENEIREQMETNFFGVQKVTRQALPLMRKTASNKEKDISTKIINISSGSGRWANPGFSAYSGSKFALEGFSEALFHELLPFGIHVVLLEPGPFNTKIFTENVRTAQASGNASSPYRSYSELLQSRADTMLTSSLFMGDAEDVARKLEKVIRSTKPRFRYLIGTMPKLRLFMRMVLPFHWYAAILHRIMFRNRRTVNHSLH